MESKIVMLPHQSDYTYSILDPSQPVQIECRNNYDQSQLSIITLVQSDVNHILKWAYPDVVYSHESLPSEKTYVFPGFILLELRRNFAEKGYEKFEARFNTEHNEYFLLGLKDSRYYHLAQWSKNEQLRTLRMIIDETAPSMHEFISHHGRIGILSVFLGSGALAMNIVHGQLESHITDSSLLLLYASYVFFGFAGAAVVWFTLNYKKFQSATVIILVENIE